MTPPTRVNRVTSKCNPVQLLAKKCNYHNFKVMLPDYLSLRYVNKDMMHTVKAVYSPAATGNCFNALNMISLESGQVSHVGLL